jgi:hypothetical protein
MNRSHSALAVLILGTLIATNAATAGIGFRVSGGYGYISYRDYNDRIDYMNSEYLPSMSIAGTLDKLHWAPEISGEVLVFLFPRFDFGLGVGLISGSRSFSIEPVGYRYEHTMKTYPITATVYAALPAPFGFAKPYVFAGGGVYYSAIVFDYDTPSAATSFTTDLSAWDFGAHAGAELRIPLAPRISLDILVRGRLAAIQGFEGTKIWDTGRTEDIFLAHGMNQQHNVIYEPKPVSERDTFHEGTVDVSGVAVALGLTMLF